MEKNKKILDKALLKLPLYSPEDKVWKTISSQLEMNTKNFLKEQMGAIQPPDFIWEKIDAELTRHDKISSLTHINPPEMVWEKIELQLAEKESRSSNRKAILFMSWTSAIAAILIFGFLISSLFHSKPNNITYSEEWIEIPKKLQWNENEEEIELTLNLLCSERPTVCQSPDYKKLKQELSFLNESKQAILNQLSKYETNPELEQLLVKIELERTSLIKEMIDKTI
ncbi:MAG: hypothetical protein KQI35_15450 [Bacteroidetes bacterium]|nr:hypothetical protein [Bacteroidota bacterium]